MHRLLARLTPGLTVLAILLTHQTVQAQDVVAEPSSYDFFTVYIPGSESMTGSIRNTTGGIVVVTDMQWTYNPLGAFSITSAISVPYPLPPGASVDYQVTFTPPSFSFWNATLRFSTDSLSTPNIDVQFFGFGDTCTAPLQLCGNECVNLDNNVAHCGACGNVCEVPENGAATCQSMTCGIQCNEGFVEQAGECVLPVPVPALRPAGGALLAAWLVAVGASVIVFIRRRRAG